MRQRVEYNGDPKAIHPAEWDTLNTDVHQTWLMVAYRARQPRTTVPAHELHRPLLDFVSEGLRTLYGREVGAEIVAQLNRTTEATPSALDDAIAEVMYWYQEDAHTIRARLDACVFGGHIAGARQASERASDVFGTDVAEELGRAYDRTHPQRYMEGRLHPETIGATPPPAPVDEPDVDAMERASYEAAEAKEYAEAAEAHQADIEAATDLVMAEALRVADEIESKLRASEAAANVERNGLMLEFRPLYGHILPSDWRHLRENAGQCPVEIWQRGAVIAVAVHVPPTDPTVEIAELLRPNYMD
jgi:hypothetical protein